MKNFLGLVTLGIKLRSSGRAAGLLVTEPSIPAPQSSVSTAKLFAATDNISILH